MSVHALLSKAAVPLTTTLRRRLRDETLYGRLPLLANERPLAAANVLITSMGYALAAWALLVGGYVGFSLGALWGTLCVVGGVLAGVTLVSICSLGCNRYGLDMVDCAKGAFGQRGCGIILAVFGFNQIGWSALIAVMFGRAVQSVLLTMGIARGQQVVTLMVVLAACAGYVSLLRSTRGFAALKRLGLPALTVLCAVVYYVILHDVAWRDLIRVPPLTADSPTRVRLIMACECAFGAGVSWWPLAARLGRYAATPRAAVYPVVLGLGGGMALMACAGLYSTLLFRNHDPTQWLVFLGGRALGGITLFILAFTFITATIRLQRGIVLLTPHIEALRSWPWPLVVALPVVPLLVCAWLPTQVVEHGRVFITLNGYLMAPVLAVLAVDTLWCRKQRLNVAQVFEGQPGGHYWFVGGFNPAALAAIAVGQAVQWSLYNPVTQATAPWALLFGASLPGFLAAAAAFSAVTMLTFRRLGSYGKEDVETTLMHPDI